jgi:hypothetical protein
MTVVYETVVVEEIEMKSKKETETALVYESEMALE